jgi:hypothetical protein
MNLGLRTDRHIAQNLLIYLSFLLIAWIGSLYGNAISGDHTFLRVWQVDNIFILLLGLPFLLLQSKVSLPNFFETGISNKNRFLIPALIGMVFGILDILVIKVLLQPQPYTELPPYLQPFPYSLFLFFSGALEIEVFYRLIPLTVFLAIGTWYQKGKYLNTLFWIGAILTSLREPLEQLPDGSFLLIFYSLGTGLLMNLLQAIYFKNSGFLASLSVRLGHYLFWHILLGIYVELVELG